MKIQFLCLIIILFAGLLVAGARAQNKISPANHAHELFQAGEEEAALQIYLDIFDDDPLHYNALWNSVIIYSNKGKRQENETERQKLIETSIEYAEKLLVHHPNRGHSHYAYAVALARKSEQMRTRDRIRAAHEIRDHIEKASNLIPEFAPVWHLYGVWHSDVANVSRGARLMARFISSGLPDGSNEKAEKYLLKSMEMDPKNVLVHFDLARHYSEVGRNADADLILNKMLELEPRMKDDPVYQEEARKMIDNRD